MTDLTPRARFIAALERRTLAGRVPHFELVFYLTMEAFGRVHPLQRDYSQWLQMEEKERQLHRRDMAEYSSRPQSVMSTALFSSIPTREILMNVPA